MNILSILGSFLRRVPCVLILSAGWATSPLQGSLIGINGLVDLFDPNQGIVVDSNGAVASWQNLANSSRSTGASANTQMVSGPNGQSMIRFTTPVDGGHLGYASPGSSSLNLGYSVMLVLRMNEPIAVGNTFPRLWRGANDAHAFFLRKSSENLEVKANPLGISDRPAAPYENSYAIGDIAILTARLTSTSQELFFNGTLVSSSAVAIGSYAIDDSSFQIGNSVRGDIGHVLVFDRTATVEDLGQAGIELARRYGTAWDGSILVPEPSTSTLVVLGALFLSRWRARARKCG